MDCTHTTTTITRKQENQYGNASDFQEMPQNWVLMHMHTTTVNPSWQHVKVTSNVVPAAYVNWDDCRIEGKHLTCLHMFQTSVVKK